MNTKPRMKTMYALLELMIESCLFRFRDPTIEANESFTPENRNENAIDRVNILRMVSEIRNDAAVRTTNTIRLIPVSYLTRS